MTCKICFGRCRLIDGRWYCVLCKRTYWTKP
jgi:hypothetical protein